MSGPLLTFFGVAFMALCGLIGGVAASIVSSRATERATNAQRQIDERKVSREDFDSITANLWKSIGALQVELEDERKARATAEHRAELADERAAAADRRAHGAETYAHGLERRIEQLESALEANNLTVPPAEPTAD